jgi:hypothetical protein
MYYSIYCTKCRYKQQSEGEAGERLRIKRYDDYHNNFKTNPERMANSLLRLRAYKRRVDKQKQLKWKKMMENMPQCQHFPSTTSKFALEVYKEVFEALAPYNIKLKAKFNYLGHHLYYKATNRAECGTRTDLLVEVELVNQNKPVTIVIEAQD